MSKPLLLTILALALALRLFNAIYIPGQGGDLIISDMQGYDRAAIALLQQKPLGVHTVERYLFHPLGSDTYHPPGFYYFLAAVYAIFGHSYVAVRIAQAALGTVTCLLIYLLGREAFGVKAGLCAATFAAIYPPLIFYTGVLLTETLSTCLLAAGVWLSLRSARPMVPRALLLAACGLLLGLAGLTRPVLLIAVPVALLWSLLIVRRWRGWQQAARLSLAICLPAALVIAPITLRNYQLHKEFVFIATNGGVNFFLGHGGSPAWKDQIRGIPAEYSDGDSLIGISNRTSTEEEAYFYQLGWEHIRQHPTHAFRDALDKLRPMYWDSDYWPASDLQAQFMRTLDTVLWRMLLLPLSFLAATWAPAGKPRGRLLLVGLAASSLVIPLVFWGQTRFRVPFLPCFIALAAGAVHELYTRVTGSSSAAAKASLAR